MKEILEMLRRMEMNIGNRCQVNISNRKDGLVFDVYFPGGGHLREGVTTSQIEKAIGGSQSIEDMIVRHARDYFRDLD